MAVTGAGKSGVVYNHDVLGLYNRMNRFIIEAMQAVSSGLSLINQFDIDRLTTYLNAIDSYHAWVQAQPQLDLPETAPREYPLETAPVVPDLENEDVSDWIRLMVVARDELVNSQSARMGAGMMGPDSARLTAVVSKARSFIETYVKVTQPLDLPESSPEQPLAGSGRTGV